MFNPRTHAGCDYRALARASTPRLFQSTHPRRVRQHRRMDAEGPRNVSIHAPTQGATIAPPRVAIAAVAFQSTHPRRVRLEGFPLLYAIEGVSIHAPTQGATISRSYSVLNLLFQSTHPRRVRHFLGGSRIARAVSIHAPTQGATPAGRPAGTRASGFNPRTHAGCDQLDVWVASQRIEFQSTHPRRVRLRRPAGLPGRGCRFNPRTHAGCDATALRSLP